VISTHGLDPACLKWRRPEKAYKIQEKSFFRGMEAAMTSQLGLIQYQASRLEVLSRQPD
jgi:hypothetical protein